MVINGHCIAINDNLVAIDGNEIATNSCKCSACFVFSESKFAGDRPPGSKYIRLKWCHQLRHRSVVFVRPFCTFARSSALGKTELLLGESSIIVCSNDLQMSLFLLWASSKVLRGFGCL